MNTITTPLALPAPGSLSPNRPTRARRPADQRTEEWEEAENAAELGAAREHEEDRPQQPQQFARFLIGSDEQLPEVMRLGWIGPSLAFYIQIYVQEHLGKGIHYDPWHYATAAYQKVYERSLKMAGKQAR
ncbi:hypothetical protein ACFSM5_03090 [Lacibacterium aquatile]|uniref:DUF3310 domain-containing protein n=1 Tax=Lacibacterium aquatile TaxID=1168082 RepID=A0ABW5DL61_9PROT